MPLQTNDTPDHHDETAQSSVSLPQELIDHILDELREDIWSLEACSLVSHSFLRESRRLLFSRVEIWDSKFVARTGMFARIPRSFRGSGKLLGLLCESPSISLCIKDLKVIGSSWISDETHSLEAVLDMLLNLESISFKGTSPLRVNYGPPGGGQWLAKEIIRLKDSLVTVSQSPNLRRVSFDTHRLPDISKFFSMFNGSGLTHLSLDDVHFAEYQRPPRKCNYRLLSLRLDLPGRAHAELIRCLLQYRKMIDIGHLRDLFIAVRHPAMFGTIKQLMDALRGSLQHLRIRKRRSPCLTIQLTDPRKSSSQESASPRNGNRSTSSTYSNLILSHSHLLRPSQASPNWTASTRWSTSLAQSIRWRLSEKYGSISMSPFRPSYAAAIGRLPESTCYPGPRWIHYSLNPICVIPVLSSSTIDHMIQR